MRICVIGEGMVELSGAEGDWRVAYGGDTLNTAIHLTRYGREVQYFTALGPDRFSANMTAAWAREGLDTGLVLTDPERLPGLYAITTDAAGERSFSYWRGDSAARRMFALPESAAAIDTAASADLILFSLITLAVLPADSQEILLDLCGRARAGGARIAFDSNYRPRLWRSAAEARVCRDRALAVCDIGLPTLGDEALLQEQPAMSAEQVAAHWRAAGVGEVAVKMGAEGCLTLEGMNAPPPAPNIADTSGGGDAFNAGYLSAEQNRNIDLRPYLS